MEIAKIMIVVFFASLLIQMAFSLGEIKERVFSIPQCHSGKEQVWKTDGRKMYDCVAGFWVEDLDWANTKKG